MKKAEVRKNRWWGWWAAEFDTPDGRYRAIHPTHAAALAHALRVQALHYPIEGIHCTIVCAHRHCVDDMQDQCEWPCPTALAIEGVA